MRPNKTRMGSSEKNERDEDVVCIQYIEEVNEIKYYEKKTNKEEEKEKNGANKGSCRKTRRKGKKRRKKSKKKRSSKEMEGNEDDWIVDSSATDDDEDDEGKEEEEVQRRYPERDCRSKWRHVAYPTLRCVVALRALDCNNNSGKGGSKQRVNRMTLKLELLSAAPLVFTRTQCTHAPISVHIWQ